MKRPDWWPGAWKWPGEGAPVPAARRVEPTRTGPVLTSRSGDPIGTFLRVLVSGFGAERAVLYRMDRQADRWTPVRGASGDADAARPFRVRGHPLTWCARERLVVQIPTADLPDAPAGVSWLLAGGLPGGDRVLVLAFAGAPPTAARRMMEAAVEHLAALPQEPASEGRTN